MTLPRLVIDLDKIEHNARTLVGQLGRSGIGVTGVTKAALGAPEIAAAFLKAGISRLGDSRIENIERMRLAGVQSEITLIRSPMLSQIDRVVQHADESFNTELDIVAALSSAAQMLNKTHNIVLMVELGDLREGIMPGDLLKSVEAILRLPNIKFKGIGANLACLNGVTPDAAKMTALSDLADLIDAEFGPITEVVSGGNSASIDWASSGGEIGRINNLRLGEAILLGRETLHRRKIDGLHQDAMKLVAEVIEVKMKPSQPWGEIAQNAFGEARIPSNDGSVVRVILALGCQDIDPAGLVLPPGLEVVGASSDHLVLDAAGCRPAIGEEVVFQLNYSAVLRAMTSPFVSKGFCRDEAVGALRSKMLRS